MKVQYHVDELDQLPDGPAMQEELAKMTGQRTVPNIFIGGVHVGGNDALQHAKEKGKLEKLFQEAGEMKACFLCVPVGLACGFQLASHLCPSLM